MGTSARKHTQTSTPKTAATPRLFALSANTPDSLRRRLVDIQTYIDTHHDAIDDVAHTLAYRREQLPHRAFGITSSTDPMRVSNFTKISRNIPRLTWVFTGQGAQWATMGIELLNSFPQFRHDIMYLDKVLHELPHGPEWSMQGILFMSSHAYW